MVCVADMYDSLVCSEGKPLTLYSKEEVFYKIMHGECGELSPDMKACLENAKERLEQIVTESFSLQLR